MMDDKDDGGYDSIKIHDESLANRSFDREISSLIKTTTASAPLSLSANPGVVISSAAKKSTTASASSASPSAICLNDSIVIKSDPSDSIFALPSRNGETLLVLPPGVQIFCAQDTEVRQMTEEDVTKLDGGVKKDKL